MERALFTDDKIVIFDLEFTDSNEGLPEIFEIGAIKVDRSLNVLSTYDTLVKPTYLDKFTLYNTELSSINREDLESCGSWQDVWRSFAAFTHFQHLRLCSWNAPSDISVLRQAYSSIHIGFPHNYMCIEAATVFDTGAAFLGYSKQSNSLDKLAKDFLGKEQVHRALKDCYLILGLFNFLLQEETDCSFNLLEF